uniref:Uncharacterized protein n=1 Tax=Globodera rostochiensis TaxID=31243 RepID=A0A914HL69_GLORO
MIVRLQNMRYIIKLPALRSTTIRRARFGTHDSARTIRRARFGAHDSARHDSAPTIITKNLSAPNRAALKRVRRIVRAESRCTAALVTDGPFERLPNICGPDICGPDICGPDFCGPDFCGPDFCGPDFCGPDFCGYSENRTFAARHLRPDICAPDICGQNTFAARHFAILGA